MAISRCIVFIIVHLFIGLLILVGTEKVTFPSFLPGPVILLAIFLLLNIIYDRIFKLNAIVQYWSPRKTPYLLAAIPFGVCIALFPIAIGLATGTLDSSGIQLTGAISIQSVFITLAIVAWEELWFRGVFLNYCNKHISATVLSVLMGILFCGVHLFNPEFSLIEKGPALFGAGALLTILYFYYRNIWVPLGLHFGNNYTGKLISTGSDNSDGYISATLLILLFIVFAVKMRKKGT